MIGEVGRTTVVSGLRFVILVSSYTRRILVRWLERQRSARKVVSTASSPDKLIRDGIAANERMP